MSDLNLTANLTLDGLWKIDDDVPLVPEHNEELEAGKEALVYKRNELIHSKHHLSATAQKIMAGLLSMIDPRSSDLGDLTFTVTALSSLLGISRQTLHKAIDPVTTELQSQVVVVPKLDTVNGQTKGFTKFSWFSHCEYDSDDQEVTFRFSHKIKPYVLELTGHFTKYEFSQIKQIKSRHAIRLYEIFRRHLTMADVERGTKHTIRTISVDHLKALLGLESKYPKVSQLERCVLKVAQTELSIQTDLRFEYQIIERIGRKSGSKMPAGNIRFTIYSNRSDKLKAQEGMLSIDSLSSNSKIKALKAKYTPEQIQTAMEALAEANSIGTDIKNPFGYVVSVLRKQVDIETGLTKKQTKNRRITGAVLDINNTAW